MVEQKSLLNIPGDRNYSFSVTKTTPGSLSVIFKFNFVVMPRGCSVVMPRGHNQNVHSVIHSFILFMSSRRISLASKLNFIISKEPF